MEQKSTYRIMGISWYYFVPFLAIYIIAMYIGKLPNGLIGALGSMIVLGALFDEIGNKTPIIKDFLGGGAIVAIFAGGLIVHFSLIPEDTIKNITTFMKGGGFLDFYIAALICGSILGMSREFLIKSFVRYIPLILGGVIVALVLVGIGGAVMGYGAKRAILYIGLPIMGGGVGAGAVPLSKIFGEVLNEDPSAMISVMLPAVSLGNCFAIVLAGILDKIGQKVKGLSGEGKLMIKQQDDPKESVIENITNMKVFGIGIAISSAFFIFGLILSKWIPIHNYALMIITVALVKAFNILPKEYGDRCSQWYKLVADNFTPALLIGIGVVYLNISDVLSAITVEYVVLVFLTVIGAVLGSGFVGKLLGFYPIEASLTAGLCMANMGGTGDVAILSAAKRMNLMPFAQISSRIGGAFIILLATAILNMLY